MPIKNWFECLIGRHKWVLSSVFTDGMLSLSNYYCKHCKMVVTMSTLSNANMFDNKLQSHWIDDLSQKVEEALEKNP